jgi:hypothetical protein
MCWATVRWSVQIHVLLNEHRCVAKVLPSAIATHIRLQDFGAGLRLKIMNYAPSSPPFLRSLGPASHLKPSS